MMKFYQIFLQLNIMIHECEGFFAESATEMFGETKPLVGDFYEETHSQATQMDKRLQHT